MLKVLGAVVAMAMVLAGCQGGTVKATVGCPVTVANGSTPPGQPAAKEGHGNGQMWTWLWPEGTVVFKPGGPGQMHSDGALEMKWPWWRGVQGKLVVDGESLDGAAGRVTAWVPEGYGENGFQATGLRFPSAGCWEVTGKVGEATLTFVTRVVVER